MVRDAESAGSLKFVLVTNRPTDVSFTVQVCTEDIAVGPDLDMATGWVKIATVTVEPQIRTILPNY